MITKEFKHGSFEGEKGKILDLDIKQLSEEGEFEGYASVYSNVDQGGDIVQKGAFDESLRKRPAGKVKMLLHHDTRKLVGTWQSMYSDNHGLFVKGQLLLSTQIGRETYEQLKAGVMDGMSIGYRTLEYEYDRQAEVRTIVKADLMEVSLVTFPMNDLSTVTNVKNASNIRTIREFEGFLRDVGGFSNAQAKAIASSGYKSSEPRDEDGKKEIDEGVEALNRLAEAFRS